MTEDVDIIVPRELSGEETVLVCRWLVPDGTRVEVGAEVVDIGTTKATIALEASAAGYLCVECGEGERVAVGSRLGRITECAADVDEAPPSAVDAHVPLQPADVEARASVRELRAQLQELRRTLDAQHRRHVPIGTLLHDRWQLASERGFGAGTSVYDECLMLGDVQVGAHCWIGPFTVLDGSRGALRIGDHTQIGTGTHVYTHNSIAQCLTGGRARPFGAPTTIGRCCFISPQSVVAAGTVLGDHCFVASGSFVEGQFPSYSYIAGAPAERVGRVEIDGERVRFVRDGQSQ